MGRCFTVAPWCPCLVPYHPTNTTHTCYTQNWRMSRVRLSDKQDKSLFFTRSKYIGIGHQFFVDYLFTEKMSDFRTGVYNEKVAEWSTMAKSHSQVRWKKWLMYNIHSQITKRSGHKKNHWKYTRACSMWHPSRLKLVRTIKYTVQATMTRNNELFKSTRLEFNTC